MIRIVFLVSSILFFNLLLGQEKTKDYFLQKSATQKTTGWILLGAGTAAVITGIIIESPNRGTGNSQSFAGGLIVAGGIVSAATSIPFFIGSLINKKRAAKLSINSNTIVLPFSNAFLNMRHTVVALSIPLNPKIISHCSFNY